MRREPNDGLQEAGRPSQQGKPGLPLSFPPQEVRKCEALIIENLSLTTSWTFFALTLRIMHLAELTDLPKDIFKHHFWRLAITHNVLMLHVLLLIKLNYPDLFSQNDRRIILNQLLSHCGNTQL